MSERKLPDLERRKTLRLQEIEDVYGVPAETVRKWIKRDKNGKVPPLEAFKPGKDYLIEPKTFELYLKKFPAA